jgi:hypothetical protein
MGPSSLSIRTTKLTVRQHETISVKPFGIRGTIPHCVFVQRNTDGSHANGRASVTSAILVADVEQEIPEIQDRKVIIAHEGRVALFGGVFVLDKTVAVRLLLVHRVCRDVQLSSVGRARGI